MFRIAIMGCGVVGSGVADILLEKSKELSKKYNKTLELGKILDIRDMKGTAYEMYVTHNADDIFSDESIKLVVMTIGGLNGAYALSKRALESGRHVVTSNKEVVAEYGRQLTHIAYENNVRFMYEASTGGGIPIIRPLNICLASNDIYEIQGILNGTTNYILTKMYRDKVSFKDALKLAQDKGYAEADPSADVDGHDAARKIAILSSVAYDSFVDYKNVKCEGIRDIVYEDHELAAKAGYVVKLIARSIKKDGCISASVEPLLLREMHMLARVNSVFNGILVKGSYTGDCMFYGKGAGKLPTASAILGDIIEVLSNGDIPSLPGFVDKDAVMNGCNISQSRYFIRFDKDGVNEEELINIMKNVFGPVSVYCGISEKNSNIAALITGFFNEDHIKLKQEVFTKATNVIIQKVIKLED